MNAQATFPTRRRAASTVELAIIAPVLLTVLFGIVEFGWYFMARQMVHHAAAETSRLATLPGYDFDTCGDCGLPAHAAALLEGPLNVTAADVDVTRDPATSANDPCETITVVVQVEKIALPGFVLKLTPIYGGNIEFDVINAHPTWAGLSNAPCQLSPP
jgi:hypothetical protein